MGFVGTERGARAVLLSESLSFDGPEGGTLTVTSQRPGDDDQFERARTWAPTGPYLASPRGNAQAPGDGARPTPRPVEVDWAPATVLVDGEAAPFEVSDFGDGYWAAVGCLADATVTIDSRGVPLSAVQLERLASRRPPPPAPPDIGERSAAVMQALDERFARLPFGRVHRFADHWALRSIEVEYARHLAGKERLSEPQFAALERYWLRRVEAPLGDKLDELRFKQVEARHRQPARELPVQRSRNRPGYPALLGVVRAAARLSRPHRQPRRQHAAHGGAHAEAVVLPADPAGQRPDRDVHGAQ